MYGQNHIKFKMNGNSCSNFGDITDGKMKTVSEPFINLVRVVRNMQNQ